jgi:SAM-dependent methyltransferase
MAAGPAAAKTDLMTDTRNTQYLFKTGSELGLQHMNFLAEMFDRHTFGVLDPIAVGPGQRCLDLGAGGGSVTDWLADRVGPTGEVVAIDIDTTRLTDGPVIAVHRHDINDGLPGPMAGPYDLIHARLTLTHLPRRDAIFADLVDALAPGGWIVIGDCTGRPLTVLAARSQQDVAVWERIQRLSHEVVSPAGGIDFGWAHRINDAMVDAGLTGVHGIEVSETVDGGSPGALLHATLNLQATEPLLAAGAEPRELERYRELTRDPGFRTWFYQFVCFRGQKTPN